MGAKSVRAASRRDFLRLEAAPTKVNHFKMRIADNLEFSRSANRKAGTLRMYHFCTYFDHRFLDRGLALHDSLVQHCESFLLWILCMDHRCHEVLSSMRLPSVRLLSLQELEAADCELREAKQTRSKIEYYFTCSPAFPLYLLEAYPELKEITYLDADLYFFDSPSIVYEEIASSSIAIIPHRFPWRIRHKEKYGIYNVGLIYFRKDENGLSCLRWWRQRCLDWCHAWVEKDRFADQKYLDQWPTLFEGVTVLKNKGLNLAVWNMANFHISRDNAGLVRVDELPLIFFHFQGLRRIRPWLYDPYSLNSRIILSANTKRIIFVPYIRTLMRMKRKASLFELSEMCSENHEPFHVGPSSGVRMLELFKACIHAALSVITWNYIKVNSEN